jgi:CRISPR-associated protein Cas1
MNEYFYVKHTDKYSFIYIEQGLLHRKDYGLRFTTKEQFFEIPVGMISTIMVGPGVSVTHAGAVLVSRMKCMLMWVGEDMSTLYAYSGCEDRKNDNILKQIKIYNRYKDKMALKLFCKRFKEDYNPKKLNLKILMGMEGAKVKEKYFELAKKYGVPWMGRKISGEWNDQTVYNQALSLCNHCLYGIVSSALQALGYISALGVIHEGNMQSLVFDIADIYKIEYSLPIAFEAASIKDINLKDWVKSKMKSLIIEKDFMALVVSDIEELMNEDSYR